MRIAFYAPLKSPNHPNPSGDRVLARLLIDALRHAGHEVTLASELRSFEGHGDTERQCAIRVEALAQADRLILNYASTSPPDAWLTYHVYHKAPDWIGPRVSHALGIPYLVAEASLSPRQEWGAWRAGHLQTVHCLTQADAVVVLNRRDSECTLPYLAANSVVLEIAPFIDPEKWLEPPPPHRTLGQPLALVSVAMMREGDKLSSWFRLADWLEHIPDTDWTLDVVGDGVARERVEWRLREISAERTRFHGRLGDATLRQVLDSCHLFVWPAINEAFGMALLEAQARGLAVVAGRHGGVAGVVCHGISGLLSSDDDSGAMAGRMIGYLARRPAVLSRMGRNARQRVDKHHNLEKAAHRLGELVNQLCVK